MQLMGKETTGLNCNFCGTVCLKFLKHLEKYHKKHIEPFPKTEEMAAKLFRRRVY